ncbi:MAG: hypothetical protein ACRD9W_05930 [Terriglobia bacterium]
MAVLILALLAPGCDFWDVLVPKEEVTYGKEYFAKLTAHDLDAVEAQLDPAARGTDTRQKLEELAALFPAQQPDHIALVGSNVTSISGTNITTYNLTFQFEYPKHWVLANVLIERKGETLLVKGVLEC